jgi:hypothetical protein
MDECPIETRGLTRRLCQLNLFFSLIDHQIESAPAKPSRLTAIGKLNELNPHPKDGFRESFS